MPDRISKYRQARMVLQIPSENSDRVYFHVTLIGVSRGVPTADIVVDGYVRGCPPDPTVEQVLECFDSALRTCMLR